MYQTIRQAVSGKELFGLRPRVTFGELLTGHHETTLAEIEETAKRILTKHTALNQAG